MQALITGGAGFLGLRLARSLLARTDVTGVVLADRTAPAGPAPDPRVAAVAGDIAEEADLRRMLHPGITHVYHLAAVVSGQAEADFDLGMRVNLDASRRLLDACRALPRPPTFVFASSLAVFGGSLTDVVSEQTAPLPQSSYGTQKAMGELLVGDYTRRGFIDGRVLRLPTVCVRPGAPNRAASSFVSGIIREPLRGQAAICPVSADLRLWLGSPKTAVENLERAGQVPAANLGDRRVIHAPGLSVTVAEMIQALERVAGPEPAARIAWRRDPEVERIVASWPGRLDASRALALGFSQDRDFESVVRQFLQDDA